MNATLEITPEALTVLALPAREGLNDGQQRGAACVWCCHGLRSVSAVDLGEQPPPERWFPRACRPCVGARAHSGFFAHAMACEHCTHRTTLCDTGRLLHQLTKRHWVSCDRCGRRIEAGRRYDEFVPESGTGFPPAVYLHAEPCERPTARRL
ncbi:MULTISPECIES: hypothetical protein [unclassified Streptomyces]|uniref:hypothetical protein n=1 Tax=unclassified Streptomyces TaxID=2593676 RepID=UPI003D7432CB